MFIVKHLSEIRLQRQQVKDRNSNIPLPSDALQLLLGNPEAFLGQSGYIFPPVNPGSSPGFSSRRVCSKCLQREVTRKTCNLAPKPPQLTRFEAQGQWLESSTSFLQMTKLFSLSIRLCLHCRSLCSIPFVFAHTYA